VIQAVCDESRLPGLQGVVAQQCAATTRTVASRARLVWGQSVTPLKNATVLDKQASAPSDFSPLLAEWALIRQDDQRFVCVNFNFDGLGRSGSFQKVRGLYLLSIPIKSSKKPALFYFVREQ